MALFSTAEPYRIYCLNLGLDFTPVQNKVKGWAQSHLDSVSASKFLPNRGEDARVPGVQMHQPLQTRLIMCSFFVQSDLIVKKYSICSPPQTKDSPQ